MVSARGLAAAAAAALVCFVAACGGDGDDGASSGPELGETVELEPISGEVTIVEPDGEEPVTLGEPKVVPLGTEVDASNGEVRLTSATSGGGTQAGEFSAGAFEVAQENGDEVTLRLAGGDFSKCETEAARRDRSTVGGPEVRRLVSNAEGKFVTRGNFASATVRGTRWVTVDACFGTLNEVDEGNLLVTDLTRGREIELGPGKQYWAAKPGRR